MIALFHAKISDETWFLQVPLKGTYFAAYPKICFDLIL